MNQTTGYRDDDIFLLNDADELPRRELLLFLKLHDGYPVPVGFHMQWTRYDFYWSVQQDYSSKAAVTVAFLRDLLDWRGSRVRAPDSYIQRKPELRPALERFLRDSGTPFKSWTAGQGKNKGSERAGWHCSLCCSLECIQDKLAAHALNNDHDRPRWVHYPDVHNAANVKNLIRQGLWLDGINAQKHSPFDSGLLYAPPSVMRNNVISLKHLLVNPYEIS